MAAAAVFLDRDGTLIRDVGYPSDPEQVRLIPGAAEALAELRAAGFRTVVISNQSGIGRGLVTAEQADAVHRRVLAELERSGAAIDASYYCPHAPDEGCPCRKPSPELVRRAADSLGLDLAGSYMVGDKPSDVETGRRAGCRTILLGSGNGPAEADAVAAGWEEAVAYILGRRESRQ